jgi:hypothetical protein
MYGVTSKWAQSTKSAAPAQVVTSSHNPLAQIGEAAAAAAMAPSANGAPSEKDEMRTLKGMHEQLEQSLAHVADEDKVGETEGENPFGDGVADRSMAVGKGQHIMRQDNEVWVHKWVDYTSKYGVGYLLCDGSSGVYFNDSSKIVLEAHGDRFHYIERSGERDVKGVRRTDGKTTLHSLSSYPDSLKKKVTLLNHFKNYLVRCTCGVFEKFTLCFMHFEHIWANTFACGSHSNHVHS